jgi:hypothetical protein
LRVRGSLLEVNPQFEFESEQLVKAIDINTAQVGMVAWAELTPEGKGLFAGAVNLANKLEVDPNQVDSPLVDFIYQWRHQL